MTARALKGWYRVHKWTSLACTLFLLILCLSGLPLIFKDEIGDWTGTTVSPPEMAANTPLASIRRRVSVRLSTTTTTFGGLKSSAPLAWK